MTATVLLGVFLTTLTVTCWLAPGRTANETETGLDPGVAQEVERGQTGLAETAGSIPVPGTMFSTSRRGSVSLAVTTPRLYRSHSAAYWARAFRHRTRQLQNTRRVLFARPSVTEAINLAATIYGNGATLWRKASCETGGTFSPDAHNSSGASGLFQFLPSTWRSTPFAGFSIWSPYANALAAGWMHARGRGGEWVCR